MVAAHTLHNVMHCNSCNAYYSLDRIVCLPIERVKEVCYYSVLIMLLLPQETASPTTAPVTVVKIVFDGKLTREEVDA